MKYLTAALAAAACIGLGWLVYRDSLERVERRSSRKEPEPIAVQVTRVQKRAIEDRIDLVGSLEPLRQVDIRSRVSGYITRLPFDVGDLVTSGKVVAEIDDTKQRELVANAEAALKVVKAQLESKKAQADLARRENERLSGLADSGVITRQELDQSGSQLAVANAEVDLELARVSQAESDVLQSKLALHELQIVAPLSGLVAERLVERGDLAQPQTPLLRIVDITSVRTMVHVVERDYEKVQVEQMATIEVDAFPGRSFEGRVIRKAPVLDLDTRTAAVQIEIENGESLLKPGMHARVRIVFDKREEADVIPIASLVERNARPAVFVVGGTPPTTRLMEVRTGINDGESVEILSALSPDDMVVTLGSRLVEHGQPVTPVEAPWLKVLSRQPSEQASSGTGD